MGSLMAPSHLTLSYLERSKSRSKENLLATGFSAVLAVFLG